MRHRNAKNKLGRTSAHYSATISNMLGALFTHGRLQTTEGKARELRRVAERTVTKAVRLGDILTRDWTTLGAAERARLIHALRIVKRTVRDREATLRMFREWAPRYLGRSGGYTSMFKLGKRRGDNAPMVLLELVPADKPESP
ncbi:MAG: 50S ribosomal protein L17 [Proteobacteria bacterium]|nr:50S ribosomal protein L17 [Pseudomonadota bacterium]